MSRRANPVVVGTFVLGGIALLLAGIMILGSGRLFRKAHTFVAYFKGSVAGLSTGSPVKFKGVDVGSVKDVQITISNDPTKPEDTRIPVLLELDEKKLRARGAMIDWEDPEAIDRLIAQGLRVQLGTSSYITGIRYISLDIFPHSVAEMANDPFAVYPELPVLSSGLDDVQKKLNDLLARVSALDLNAIVAAGERAANSATALLASIQHTAAAADALLSAPELLETIRTLHDASVEMKAAIADFHRLEADLGAEGHTVGKNLERASDSAAKALDRASAMIGSIQGMVSGNAPLLRRIEQTLSDVSDTARSFRRLADKLERDPGVILRGGNK